MWFKVHRNVNDIRKQIIAFIKKHIIILFTHKSIHNSDRKGIKYRMSYPRWSTSLVVNKQFWSDQSADDQNETEISYLTIIRPTLEYRAQQWFVIPLPKPWYRCTLENVQRRAARFVINDYTSRTQGCVTSMLTSVADFRTTEEDKQTRYDV